MKRAFALLVAVLLQLAHALDARANEPPKIEHPVTDLANVLEARDVEALADRLVRHRAATHTQVAVLVLRTTSGEPIEDYAHRVATAWRGGSQGEDKGALVVLAIDDRRSRIEVGYGLEAALPDAKAKAILDGAKPQLRERAYGPALWGIVDGVVIATGGASEPMTDASARNGSTAARTTSAPASLEDAGLTCFLAAFFAFFAVRFRIFPKRKQHGPPSGTDGVLYGVSLMFGLVAALGWLALIATEGVANRGAAGPIALSTLAGTLTALCIESLIDDTPDERTRANVGSSVFLILATVVLLGLSVSAERMLQLWAGTALALVSLPLGAAFAIGVASKSKPPVNPPSPVDPMAPHPIVPPVLPTEEEGLWLDGKRHSWDASSDATSTLWTSSDSSTDSSWSSSDSSDSSSSSDFGGGGGDFGGGGASSDW